MSALAIFADRSTDVVSNGVDYFEVTVTLTVAAETIGDAVTAVAEAVSELAVGS